MSYAEQEGAHRKYEEEVRAKLQVKDKEIEKLKKTVATWQSNYTSMKTAYEQLLKSFEIISERYKE